MMTADPRSVDRASFSFDMQAVAFGSAAEYAAYPKPEVRPAWFSTWSCGHQRTGISRGRIAQGNHPRIVFIHRTRRTSRSSVRAIKAGAVDFLTKPFKEARPDAGHQRRPRSRSRRRAEERRAGRVYIGAFRPSRHASATSCRWS